MTKLLLINESKFKPTSGKTGDVIAIKKNTHEFSKDELEKFDVVQVPDFDEADHAPEIEMVWREKGQGKFKKIKKQPKFMFRYENGKVQHNFDRDIENQEEV